MNRETDQKKVRELQRQIREKAEAQTFQYKALDPYPPQPKLKGVSPIFRSGIDPTRLGYAICRKHGALG